MGAAEVLEHMEHAAHAGHHDDHGGGGGAGHASGHGKKGTTFGMKVGLTMAILGVMLAYSGALVGASRTELITALTNQNLSQTKFQGNAARFRTLHTTLRNLYSRSAPTEEITKLRAGLTAATAGVTDPQVLATLHTLQLDLEGVIALLDPDRVQMRQMMWTAKKFMRERDAAGKWSDAYMPLVADWTEAAEHYEWGQLAAEIGIVIASIGLLLQSRMMWAGAIGLGGVALAVIITTKVETGAAVDKHEAVVEKTKDRFFELKKTQDEVGDDNQLFDDMDKRFPAVPGENDAWSQLKETMAQETEEDVE